VAEIRKFDPAAGNAIAQALKAAMGEPVRPAEPGSRPTPPDSKPAAAAPTSWIMLKVTAPEERAAEDD
jgi:hypothetical protein